VRKLSDFYEKLERLSKEQREKVGKVSKYFGFDGSSHPSFDDLVKADKKKRGRVKGQKNFTIAERLKKRYPDIY